jgi:hypothetical protein
MKEPQEFQFDPLARARRYLQKFPPPPGLQAEFASLPTQLVMSTTVVRT